MSIVWTASLQHYRVLGSSSPLAFEAKCSQLPQDGKITSGISAVFVDVLRATTTLVAVAAAGCPGIYVDVKPKEGSYPFVPPAGLDNVEPWIYGGELDGAPVAGVGASGEPVYGVIGNSPCSIVRSNFAGSYLRFFSTNGSRALTALARAKMKSIHALCLANIDFTVQAVLRRRPDRIWFTCGGFYGSSSIEDIVASGLAIKRLIDAGFAAANDLDDEARQMLVLGELFSDGESIRHETLTTELRGAQVGRLLTSIGHGDDIRASVCGIGMLDQTLWNDMANVSLAADEPVKPFVLVE